MAKATFGIAAALALSMSPAWAGEEKMDEKAAGDPIGRVGSVEQAGSEDPSERESATGGITGAGRDSRSLAEAEEARASFEERWLREREGYRDGGY